MKVLACIIAGVVVIGAGIYGLYFRVPTDDFLQKEVTAIQNRTIPATSAASHESVILRNESGAEASWEFQTEFGWSDYGAWAAKQLAEWRVLSGTGNALEFSHQLAGDLEYLRFEKVSDDPQLQIRVTFRSRPD